MLSFKILNRKNFHWTEFFESAEAAKNGINNLPKEPATLQNLFITADGCQKLRDIAGRPVIISSAYRCLELNKLVGGKAGSYHVYGLASDITIPSFSPADLRQYWGHLKEINFDCDKCILESKFDPVNNNYKYWIHIQYRADPAQNRHRFFELVVDDTPDHFNLPF